MRKELKLGLTDRVMVTIEGSPHLNEVVERYKEELSRNVLVAEFNTDTAFRKEVEDEACLREEATLDGEDVRLYMTRA
jgi:hypothetical protein